MQALFRAAQVIEFVKKPSLDEMIAKRVEFLTGYQNAAYAAGYKAFVDKVRAAEAPLAGTRLTEAVARYLFKLMAYKDEYEVARLHTDAAFGNKIASQFEGEYKLVHHLAPPASPAGTTKVSWSSSPSARGCAAPSACWPSSRACAARRSTPSAGPRSAGQSAR